MCDYFLVKTFGEPLDVFLKSARRPSDFYDAVVLTANMEKNLLPEELLKPVMANVDFYNLYKTIRQMEAELEELEGTASELGDFGAQLGVGASDFGAQPRVGAFFGSSAFGETF